MMDWRDSLTDGRLTPTMRAIVNLLDCFIAPEPVPVVLIQAALQPHAHAEIAASTTELVRLGWVTTPTTATLALTPLARTFLTEYPNSEQTHGSAILGVCKAVGQLMKARDRATLRLVEPHLHALAEAWYPRTTDYTEALVLAYGTYLGIFGDMTKAERYLDRAVELEELLGAAAQEPPRRRQRGR